MTLCEQCGSIDIERAHPQLADKFVTVVTGRRPFLCRRCGWRARRNWTDDDLKALLDYGAGGAEPDPTLAALDDDSVSKPRKRNGRKGKRKTTTLAADAFDLDPHNVASVESAAAVEGQSTPPAMAPRRIRRRRASRRREIATAVVATGVVLSLLALVGSCVTF